MYTYCMQTIPAKSPGNGLYINHGGVNTFAGEYGMNPKRWRGVYRALGFSDH